MNEKDYERFSQLEEVVIEALTICDPIEFLNRQKRMLYAIAECILKPYREEKAKRTEKVRSRTKKKVKKLFDTP